VNALNALVGIWAYRGGLLSECMPPSPRWSTTALGSAGRFKSASSEVRGLALRSRGKTREPGGCPVSSRVRVTGGTSRVGN
jgi:hypothetical protein